VISGVATPAAKVKIALVDLPAKARSLAWTTLGSVERPLNRDAGTPWVRGYVAKTARSSGPAHQHQDATPPPLPEETRAELRRLWKELLIADFRAENRGDAEATVTSGSARVRRVMEVL
jgi:hypothetical protein